jgi:hypothetical protein
MAGGNPAEGNTDVQINVDGSPMHGICATAAAEETYQCQPK